MTSTFDGLGFEIVPAPLFETPSEAAALAIQQDVDVVVASNLAEEKGLRLLGRNMLPADDARADAAELNR